MLIIDRFEGNTAIIEAGESILEIPRKYLPADASEGDVIKLIIDEKNTNTRKKHIEKMADSLFE